MVWIKSGEKMIYCPKCGEEVSKEADYCPSCGTPIEENEKQTKNAEKNIKTGFKESGVCSRCGSNQYRKEQLKMSGKHGIIGRGYDFTAYICERCGFSEFYFLHESLTT
ncbi:hypothetical protein AKJ37_05565 [candidate division MSBL1 archaeon SCGC-AAA259I09]|uniref:Zinc-ribbon domain-containing protein n=1 Tax=candidate division MSBL1 archaeon SCGC-AAA259I09 TaxID=1698267 RepID=A0A133UQ00_9EURY|nr:hypothetical protein AKJ37_05565 [candidate division MSBL1 archaeon SCGC-AAA259I09]